MNLNLLTTTVKSMLVAGIVAGVTATALAQNSTITPPSDPLAPRTSNEFTDPKRRQSIRTAEEQKAEMDQLARANALSIKGDEANGKGKLDDAIRLYQQSLQANSAPSNIAARTGLGNALAQEGKFADALAAYDTLWYTDGSGKKFSADGSFDKDVVLVRYALLLRQAGRLPDALLAFQHAMQDDDMIRGLSHISVSKNVSLDTEDMETVEFDKAAYLALGVALSRTNRSDEAIPYLEKAVKLNHGSGLSYFFLASAYQGSKDLEMRKKSKAAYEKAAATGNAEVSQQAKHWLKVTAPQSSIAK